MRPTFFAVGPSRHIASPLVAFGVEADINRQAEPAGLVANDPKRSKMCRNAAAVSYSIFCCRGIFVLAGIEFHARYVDARMA